MEKKRIDYLLDMLTEDPTDSFLIYALALEYEKSGEIDKSIDQLLSLKTNQPNYLATYYQLGKLLELKDKINESIVVYKEGIEIAKHQKNIKIENELKEALSHFDDSL